MPLYPDYLDIQTPEGNASVGLIDGKFSNGNPINKLPPSRLPAEHLNLLTDLLTKVIEHDHTISNPQDTEQLLSAIQKLSLGVSQTQNQKLQLEIEQLQATITAIQSKIQGLSKSDTAETDGLYYGMIHLSLVHPDKPRPGWWLCNGQSLERKTKPGGRYYQFLLDHSQKPSDHMGLNAQGERILFLPDFFDKKDKKGRFFRPSMTPWVKEDAAISYRDIVKSIGHTIPRMDETDQSKYTFGFVAGFRLMPRDIEKTDHDDTRPACFHLAPYIYLGT